MATTKRKTRAGRGTSVAPQAEPRVDLAPSVDPDAPYVHPLVAAARQGEQVDLGASLNVPDDE